MKNTQQDNQEVQVQIPHRLAQYMAAGLKAYINESINELKLHKRLLKMTREGMKKKNAFTGLYDPVQLANTCKEQWKNLRNLEEKQRILKRALGNPLSPVSMQDLNSFLQRGHSQFEGVFEPLGDFINAHPYPVKPSTNLNADS
jgi:DNA replication protein DnaD